MLSISQMYIFLVAVESGTLEEAAVKLGIGQPSVTRHLKRIEAEFRTPLFEKNRRPLRLTDNGRRMKRHCERILRNYRVMEQDLRTHDRSDMVTIAITESLTTSVISEAIPAFAREYPDVRFDTVFWGEKEVRNAFNDEMINLAVLSTAGRRFAPYVIKTFPGRRWGIIMPGGAPLSSKDYIVPEDLRGRSLIIPSSGGERELVEKWLGPGLRTGRRSYANTVNSCIMLVAAGFGYGFIPLTGRRTDPEGRFAVIPMYPVVAPSASVLVRDRELLNPAEKKFVDHILRM